MKKILSVLLISAFLISFLPCTGVHAAAGMTAALYDDDTEVPDDPDDLYDYDDREDMVEEQAEPESTEVKKPKKKRKGATDRIAGMLIRVITLAGAVIGILIYVLIYLKEKEKDGAAVRNAVKDDNGEKLSFKEKLLRTAKNVWEEIKRLFREELKKP
ncbi:MAG: hypothetical protein IKI74_00355 [Christensenellaceae bacterium]|nr:hypothetical protein [Christensenellaceae bacterium]